MRGSAPSPCRVALVTVRRFCDHIEVARQIRYSRAMTPEGQAPAGATPTLPVSVSDHTSFKVAWREAGSGPPVLFLHGLGGTRTAWGPQLRGLAGRFRCIAWDMPGYGHSQPVSPLTFDAISDRVVALLDHLEIDTVDIVGLSFGGMHALHTAINHKSRVNRMILANTSPAFGLDGTTAEGWIRSRLDPISEGGTPGDLAETVVDAIAARPLTGRIRAEVVGAFSEIPAAGFRAAVECLPTHDVRSLLPAVEHPALVIVGEHDEETPVAYSELLADLLPHAELRILPGVGHLSPSEAPERFNQLVADFLSPDHHYTAE